MAQWVRAHALQTLGPEFDCPVSMLENKTNKTRDGCTCL